jgi:hypothetical protein
METMDEIVFQNPLVSPEQIDYRRDHFPVYQQEEEPYTESEVTENNAQSASIENIITVLLTGAAPGLTFSTEAGTKQAEIARLNKWLRIKLFTKINNPVLKDDFIRLVRGMTPSFSVFGSVMILLINHIFDFKNRIVRIANGEYSSWHSTLVNGTYAIKEYDPGALNLLTKYWNATPTPPAPITSGPMWSAAFISWVMKEAGATDLFKYSGAHITYMRAARINRRDTTQNPFRLYRINEFIPRMQPGDLVCKARAGSGLTFDNVLTHGNTAAHVDIITEIDRTNNRLRVVGGNICDNVDHKGLNVVGGNMITNSDGERYFAGIGIGNE